MKHGACLVVEGFVVFFQKYLQIPYMVAGFLKSSQITT